MARRRKGLPISGWLVIDKPVGLTSTQVVAKVRRITGAQKVGHGGTLDPLASGLLPIALGEATKTVAYVMDGAKAYSFRLKWGEATTTDDAEGPVIETSELRPDDAAIEAALDAFRGDIEQIPPAFSAVKVDGQRAYDLARAAKPVELKSRIVKVLEFRLSGRPDPDHAEFEVRCGKGTYVRALARDLARKLGTCGHLVGLRRTSVGPFREADAISLEKLEQLGHSAAAQENLLAVETALDDIPALALTEQEANRLRTGQSVSLLKMALRTPLEGIVQGTTVRAMSQGKLVALARIEHGEVLPVRVMNL